MGRGQAQYLTAATRRGSRFPEGGNVFQSGSMGGDKIPGLTEEQRKRMQNALSSLEGEGSARTVPASLLSKVAPGASFPGQPFVITDGTE